MSWLTNELLVNLILVVLLSVLAYSLIRLHRRPDVEFNLFDLVMHNGRASKIGFAFMVTLIVSSWVIIHMTVVNKIDAGVFTAYLGAWVAPIVASIFKTQPTAVIPEDEKEK